MKSNSKAIIGRDPIDPNRPRVDSTAPRLLPRDSAAPPPSRQHRPAGHRLSLLAAPPTQPHLIIPSTKTESHCQELPPRWSHRPRLSIPDPIVSKSEASLERSRWPNLRHQYWL
ncbi:hypothetical protein PVAP13_5KG564307 [Panicum virgatum]|uniref:Uncharacterized protein n=1 Tax=Panicum virgatum TaxID=38727 RepID=A0A8T0SY67_PANVG|nr:hypothetical protein PVAP13_5KG564307 [Panicum virgatum]